MTESQSSSIEDENVELKRKRSGWKKRAELRKSATQTPNLQNINHLRKVMKCPKFPDQTLQGYIIPNTDSHMSLHLVLPYQRVRFLSGFSGYGGTVFVSEDLAALWVSAEFYGKAKTEVTPEWIVMNKDNPSSPTLVDWVSANLPPKSRIGCDPKLVKYADWIEWDKEFFKRNQHLVSIRLNLVDQIWKNKPSEPKLPINPLETNYLGATAAKKIEDILNRMQKKKMDALLINTVDDIAWLLNLRGHDVQFETIFLSYLIIMEHHIHIFVDDSKFGSDVQNYLKKQKLSVKIHKYSQFFDFVNFLAEAPVVKKICITPSASYEEYSSIPNYKRYCDTNFISEAKCIKNSAEAEGMILAQVKEGVALCRLFAWLDKSVCKGNVTEVSAALKLAGFRQEDMDYVCPSYLTISSSGPNTAMVHYTPSPVKERPLSTELYYCDAGAQYKCGTTCLARTVHFGKPTEHQMNSYTRVLKGLIALESVRFPEKITGDMLDAVCRKPLWGAGFNYDHETGHGVGAYLRVEEGPIGFFKSRRPDDPGLMPNMFLSAGPAYFHRSEYGIRLKNVLQVVPSPLDNMVTDTTFLRFIPVTFCPFNTKMIVLSKLSNAELDHLNEFHELCLVTIGPILMQKGLGEVHKWLVEATRPLLKTEEQS